MGHKVTHSYQRSETEEVTQVRGVLITKGNIKFLYKNKHTGYK